jgi:hypothetical protein
MRIQRAELPLKLDGLEASRTFFAGCFADSDPGRESLWVAHVDAQARCLHVTRHGGDESGAEFPLRAIIADAAVHGSAAPRAGSPRRRKRSIARSSIIWCSPAPSAPACAGWACSSPVTVIASEAKQSSV